MDKFVSWFYSKDFSFWQNLGHILVVLVLTLLLFAFLVK